MKISVTITTVNNFESEASYLEWRRAMEQNLSIVDFEILEQVGKYIINSGDANDGSTSFYTYEASK